MASFNLFHSLLLFLPLMGTSSAVEFPIKDDLEPFNCSTKISSCNASLYHKNQNLTMDKIASSYSVNLSQIKPIVTHGSRRDYLITVPCSCKNTSDLDGYFYDTVYNVQANEIFQKIKDTVYSGQAWPPKDYSLKPGQNLTIHLPCGCSETESQIVVTYTVQQNDTPAEIADLLSANLLNIMKMNTYLLENPSYINVGWVLFVPMELNGLPSSPIDASSGKKHRWGIIIGILASVTLLSVITMFFLILRRNRANKISKENPKSLSKNSSLYRTHTLKSSHLHTENMEAPFESEGHRVFNLEEIEEATNNFDETRRIGGGGYGTVYFGTLGDKEVAIKMMRSNKSKEFYAELKVLYKIHHINIVELLGYASGEDHLFLVYEYVTNGSLSDHLHNPLLKGYQPLSWAARVQIALDVAKGLEYIHDYTKARYVHRDVKTSNILLDEKLRAKVSDFGLAKLVERTNNNDDFIATKLVGTPGYLPPESVKELQVTPKTDVFAFGVVLAELITGKRALFRDSKEASNMKPLITIVNNIFQNDDPEVALENEIDENLRGSCPIEDVFKTAEIAEWCMSEEAINRPEMREVVVTLSQLVMSSTEWEASLGGNNPVLNGR
ncbi:hypothetical protein L6164_027285 [Bauhinia variegata]|uniref:Uncharacterized protein n=1 Tax=Bauhinia variegata TaxID=167791 RepID=A0ACB9LSS3_BAUVA|nr:hypothetical protein L6164_027285 [Bauhinia variegata]